MGHLLKVPSAVVCPTATQAGTANSEELGQRGVLGRTKAAYALFSRDPLCGCVSEKDELWSQRRGSCTA